MARQVKRMRVIIEIDMDNTAAMFNRKLFNERVRRAVDEGFATHFPQGTVYLATEEATEDMVIWSDPVSRAIV